MNQPIVRPSTAADRAGIRQILLHSGLFGARDADCVDEMFGHSLAKPTPDNYRFLSGWLDNSMSGFRLLWVGGPGPRDLGLVLGLHPAGGARTVLGGASVAGSGRVATDEAAG